MDQAFLLPIIIWLACIFLLIIRSDVSILFKAILPLFLAFYIYFWWEDIGHILKTIASGRIPLLWDIIQNGLQLAVFALFWIAPLMLISAIIAPDNRTRNWILSNLTLFSAIILGGFFAMSWI